jgi:hypothetical protein
VSLIAPSLFTPESVARITGQDLNVTSTFAFGRHFAASVDRETVVFAITLRDAMPDVNPDSEWEHREGILSWASIISHLATSADRLSPKLAAEAYVTLLILISGGWRLDGEDDSWLRVEGDDEVMDAVGRALRGLVGESNKTRGIVRDLLQVHLTSQELERLHTVVEQSLA